MSIQIILYRLFPGDYGARQCARDDGSGRRGSRVALAGVAVGGVALADPWLQLQLCICKSLMPVQRERESASQ